MSQIPLTSNNGEDFRTVTYANPFVFTDEQKVHIRRFMGYDAYGNPGANLSGWQSTRFFTNYGVLEYRLKNMSRAEGNVLVTVYLKNLLTLEQAILDAQDNIDFDKIAILGHNKTEVAERDAAMRYWSLRLCAFIGVPQGPKFASSVRWREA